MEGSGYQGLGAHGNRSISLLVRFRHNMPFHILHFIASALPAHCERGIYRRHCHQTCKQTRQQRSSRKTDVGMKQS